MTTAEGYRDSWLGNNARIQAMAKELDHGTGHREEFFSLVRWAFDEGYQYRRKIGDNIEVYRPLEEDKAPIGTIESAKCGDKLLLYGEEVARQRDLEGMERFIKDALSSQDRVTSDVLKKLDAFLGKCEKDEFDQISFDGVPLAREKDLEDRVQAISARQDSLEALQSVQDNQIENRLDQVADEVKCRAQGHISDMKQTSARLDELEKAFLELTSTVRKGFEGVENEQVRRNPAKERFEALGLARVVLALARIDAVNSGVGDFSDVQGRIRSDIRLAIDNFVQAGVSVYDRVSEILFLEGKEVESDGRPIEGDKGTNWIKQAIPPNRDAVVAGWSDTIDTKEAVHEALRWGTKEEHQEPLTLPANERHPDAGKDLRMWIRNRDGQPWRPAGRGTSEADCRRGGLQFVWSEGDPNE